MLLAWLLQFGGIRTVNVRKSVLTKCPDYRGKTTILETGNAFVCDHVCCNPSYGDILVKSILYMKDNMRDQFFKLI